jgi:hypothetical protein
MMLPGMEDTHRRHLQGLTRTAREAGATADARCCRTNAGRNVAVTIASSAGAAASESVNPVGSPSPTT